MLPHLYHSFSWVRLEERTFCTKASCFLRENSFRVVSCLVLTCSAKGVPLSFPFLTAQKTFRKARETREEGLGGEGKGVFGRVLPTRRSATSVHDQKKLAIV